MYLCPIDIAMLYISGGFWRPSWLVFQLFCLSQSLLWWCLFPTGVTRIAINFSSHTEVYSCIKLYQVVSIYEVLFDFT